MASVFPDVEVAALIALHPMIPIPILGIAAVAGTVIAAFFAIRARSALTRVRWMNRMLVILLCISLFARPTVPGEAREAQATEADVFFVVDTTISIVAEDWGQGRSRLSGVQADIESLVSQLAGARFALVTFDQVTSVDVPLTSDSSAILSAVEVLRPERSAYAVGSSVGLAHGVLAEQLRNAATQAPDRTRAVYYFGDGEHTAVEAPESFAESAPYVAGGSVFGYGTVEGGPMKDDLGGAVAPAYLMDPSTGAPALSVASPTNLTDIAGQLGVEYVGRDSETRVEAGTIQASLLAADGSALGGNDRELYWMIALGIFVLLLPETGVLLVALARSGRREGTR